MADPLCIATGNDGTVRVYEDRVEIIRKSRGAKFVHGSGEQSIPIENVATVNFREPKLIRGGYIEIIPSGYEDAGGSWSGANMECRVSFGTKQAAAFEDVRDTLHEIRQSDRASETASAEEDEPLTILQRRLARGEINEEEYEQKRELLQEEG